MMQSLADYALSILVAAVAAFLMLSIIAGIIQHVRRKELHDPAALPALAIVGATFASQRNMSAIRIIAAALLALALAGCGDDDQPDPHAMELAQQVAASSPLARWTKIKVSAKKKDYTFTILYPTFPTNGEGDATELGSVPR
jgi:hypothetical protein